MKFEGYDEVVPATQEALEQATITIKTLFPVGHTYSGVSHLAGPDVGYAGPGKDWARIRSCICRRRDSGCALSLVRDMAWPDYWNKAGGPSMQKQAMLRAHASGISYAQRELPKERS